MDRQGQRKQSLGDALHEACERLGEVVFQAHLALEVREHALDDQADARLGYLAGGARTWAVALGRGNESESANT